MDPRPLWGKMWFLLSPISSSLFPDSLEPVCDMYAYVCGCVYVIFCVYLGISKSLSNCLLLWYDDLEGLWRSSPLFVVSGIRMWDSHDQGHATDMNICSWINTTWSNSSWLHKPTLQFLDKSTACCWLKGSHACLTTCSCLTTHFCLTTCSCVSPCPLARTFLIRSSLTGIPSANQKFRSLTLLVSMASRKCVCLCPL